MYKIFIVEDHPVIRDLYVHLIRRDPDLEVCGQAATGSQALAALATTTPDLVLVDVALPDMSGLEVLRRLLAGQPDLLVLVISGQEEELYARQALVDGAKGYVDKLGLAPVLSTAIHRIVAGGTYITEHILEKIRKADANFLLNL